MSCLNDSIMRWRGVAQGRTPDSAALTEAPIMAIGRARQRPAAPGSALPLEDATRIAHQEQIPWREADCGGDRWDAQTMLSQCGHCGQVRLGNFVDPEYTVGAGISEQNLEPA